MLFDGGEEGEEEMRGIINYSGLIIDYYYDMYHYYACH